MLRGFKTTSRVLVLGRPLLLSPEVLILLLIVVWKVVLKFGPIPK